MSDFEGEPLMDVSEHPSWDEFSPEAAAAAEVVGRDGTVYASEAAKTLAESLEDLPRTPMWGKNVNDPYFRDVIEPYRPY